ncbi:deoxyribose-phosphate aldolase [Caproiciproducens sp.]|uniref:deoxyribose-phosphate aldolase n=1 Tax=Caproiciproducens sp. TaxID=1954376 RepID=UPI0028995878|nr:deoxyribose-phosphate aldolase [Caproiciproducens sp.]
MDSKTITKTELAGMIDHTLLRADASQEEFRKICEEANDNHFAMVAINSASVQLCKKLLENSSVHVGAAISFPLGQTTIETKVFETKKAIEDGCDEIDYVINIAELKQGNISFIEHEMDAIVSVCREGNIISKAIFENCYLSKEEIETVAKIAKKIKPHYIKTSTGFGTGGAEIEDVQRMKSIVGEEVLVKAAGGIRSWADAAMFIDAGASRIGTSSSLKIMRQFSERSL